MHYLSAFGFLRFRFLKYVSASSVCLGSSTLVKNTIEIFPIDSAVSSTTSVSPSSYNFRIAALLAASNTTFFFLVFHNSLLLLNHYILVNLV